MQARFLVQKLPDGTIPPDVATICEKVREWNWLQPEKAPYEIALLSLEQMQSMLPPYLPEDICEIPLGSIEFVEVFIRKMYGIERLTPLLIPKDFQAERYLGRRIATARSHELLRGKAIEWNTTRVFLKSASQLKCDYTGIYDLTRERLPDDMEFFLSEPLSILSEWRIFVWQKRIVGIHNYAGDQWLLPDKDMVEEMVSSYSNAPDAYTLDVAICNDKETGHQRTVVIEVHNFVSCGLYGFEGTMLPSMCVRGFRFAILQANH